MLFDVFTSLVWHQESSPFSEEVSNRWPWASPSVHWSYYYYSLSSGIYKSLVLVYNTIVYWHSPGGAFQWQCNAMLTHLGIDSFIFLELFLFKSRHTVVLYLKLEGNVIYKLV